MAVAIHGVHPVLKNMQREISKIEGKTLEGLFLAAALVRKESQIRTPVDTGNLRASHYVQKSGKIVEIGLTADYAVKVHEDLEVEHVTGEAKYLENAILDNRRQIVQKIASRAKVR